MIEWLMQKLRAWGVNREITKLQRMQDEEKTKLQEASDRLDAVLPPRKPDKRKVPNGA